MSNTFYPVNDYRNYLAHYGVKGMKWGVRHERAVAAPRSNAAKKVSYTDEERAARNAKIKKAAVIGASVAGVCLAAYGGYKFSKWVNQQNVNLATHAGAEFASKFGVDIKPKTQGFGSMGHHRFMVGQSKARNASAEMRRLASEKIYSQAKSPKDRIQRAFQASEISRGKKTVYDVVDYNQTIKSIMQDERVLDQGQSMFAKTMRDVIRLGGSYSREWR